jgi:hypothetical protein
LPCGSRTPFFRVMNTRAFMVSPAILGVWQPYGRAPSKGQVSHSIYLVGRRSKHGRLLNKPAKGVLMVGALAIAMFVALVGFGGKYFGWSDPDGKVMLALVTSFILGIIGGYKAKG